MIGMLNFYQINILLNYGQFLKAYNYFEQFAIRAVPNNPLD